MPGVKDRVAVVTGAANGLGREIAILLAREGARVALGDLESDGLERTAETITKAGGTTAIVVGDLTEERPAAALITTAVERFGRIDILINVVGGSRNNTKIWELNQTVDYSPNRMTPLRRLGEPIEVAHAVLFLASDKASYITGHTLAVAGGR